MDNLRCPGFDPIWGEIIDDFEKCDPKLAAKWAKRLCKEGKFHHGAFSGLGTVDNGKPYEESQSCWNCEYEVKRVTKLVHPATTQKDTDDASRT